MRFFKPLFALSALAMAMQVNAAGFALNETTASAAGTAYAGRGSNVEDASIMASNPAGIAFLERAEVTGGLGYVMPKGEFSGSATSGTSVAGQTTQDNFLKSAVIPFGYYAAPINEQWAWGIGIYAPFGATSDYDKNWVGRFMGDKTVVEVINIQPTVSFKFDETLSFGLGVVGSFADGELTRSVFTGGNEGYSQMKGDGWSYGWLAGVLWKPLPETSIGISYRSKIKHTLKGNATVTGLAAQPLVEKAKLKIDLPEVVEISLSQNLNERWTLLAGTSWTRWSRFKELVIESDQGGSGPVSGIDGTDPNVLTYVPENWKDAWAFSLGASYKYSDALTLKAGYARDNTPVQDEYRTVRIPDSDRNWLTLGAKYNFSEDWTVDAAYGYMFSSKVKINEVAHTSGGTANPAQTLTGEYKTKAHVLTMSMTKRF